MTVEAMANLDCKSCEHWMKLANEAADELDRLKLAYDESYRLGSEWRARAEDAENRLDRALELLRGFRRVPARDNGTKGAAIKRYADLEVNQTINMILAGMPNPRRSMLAIETREDGIS